MGRRDTEKGAEDILDAVIQCKLDDPAGDVQLTQIAARAGISSRTVNRYYPDKDEMLFLAAVRFLRREYDGFVDYYGSLDNEGLSGRAQLMLLLSSQRNYFRDHAGRAVSFLNASGLCMTSPYNSKKNSGCILHPGLRHLVCSCVEQGINDGSIRAVLDPPETCILLSGSFNGMMHRLVYEYNTGCEDQYPGRIDRIFNEYISMLSKYLQP